MVFIGESTVKTKTTNQTHKQKNSRNSGYSLDEESVTFPVKEQIITIVSSVGQWFVM